MTDATAARDRLLHEDPNFRRLAQKHREYEARLEELQSRRFLTDEEQADEARLKKLKLRVKDEMEALLRREGEGGGQAG